MHKRLDQLVWWPQPIQITTRRKCFWSDSETHCHLFIKWALIWVEWHPNKSVCASWKKYNWFISFSCVETSFCLLDPYLHVNSIYSYIFIHFRTWEMYYVFIKAVFINIGESSSHPQVKAAPWCRRNRAKSSKRSTTTVTKEVGHVKTAVK